MRVNRPELCSAASWRETSASPSLALVSCLDNDQVALDGPPGLPLGRWQRRDSSATSAAKVKAHGGGASCHMWERGHCIWPLQGTCTFSQDPEQRAWKQRLHPAEMRGEAGSLFPAPNTAWFLEGSIHLSASLPGHTHLPCHPRLAHRDSGKQILPTESLHPKNSGGTHLRGWEGRREVK